MNDLLAKYPGLSVACFPSNQFGHQENTSSAEMLASLRFVRPGNGFEPKADMYNKVQVNGTGAHPVFQLLKAALPAPSDPECADHLMADPSFISWSPVRRSDVAWNFEKFLVAADGSPFKRYSKNFETKDIAADIEQLLK